MADELKKKSPVPNPGSSSVSAPKSTPAPAPKTNPNPVNAPKPAANNFSVPKANPNPTPKPASNPVNNVKPQSKVDPVRQKIANQGFKPNTQAKTGNANQSFIDEISNFGGSTIGLGDGKAIEAYKNGDRYYARSYPDRENRWPSEDDMSEIWFTDENGKYLDDSGFESFEDLVDALRKSKYPIYDSLQGRNNPESSERAKASELFGTDLTKSNEEQKAEEDFGYSSDNPKDKNLYDYLTQTLGHDDMTARGLVNSYKQGKEVAGLPRWKLDQISEGTADKNHWPFNVSK